MRLANIKNHINESLYETETISNIKKCDDEFVILNDKDKIKMIKTLEKIVRSSMEYREYIEYLKDSVNMDKCSFFNNITSKNAKHRISIEIHHEPFTLYDLCRIVLEKFIKKFDYIWPLSIAEEVMKIHYQNKVGVLPLSVTVHQLVHSGKIFIPLQCVYGDYCTFLEEYKPYISQELNDILYMKLQMSKNENDLSILEKKFIYLQTEGIESLEKIQ
jgi:hypothetical protein